MKNQIINRKTKEGQKILVAYASQFGSTAEVAQAIGQVLAQNGNTVETKWIENIIGLNSYDAVIIGSAIQYDRWMPVATGFVRRHQNVLSKLPVAYFFTCLTLAQQSEKAERQAKVYADKLHTLLPQVMPVSIGRFAGAIDYRQLSFAFRLLFKGLSTITGVQEGDYRDWEAIRAWANSMHFELAGERVSSLEIA